jgi:hypothetical protein
VPKVPGSGFFSSATTLPLPTGPAIDPAGVRGYAIDLRIKADESGWPQPWLRGPDEKLWVEATQYGLGAWERHVAGDGEQWLASAVGCAAYLADGLDDEGRLLHHFAYPHTFSLSPPWPSAISQGQAASLLARAHVATGEERFADAARHALRPMTVSSGEGGCMALLDGRPYPEEYPTHPPSFVLNGSMFALWGFRDVAVGLSDPAARAAWEQGVATLADNLHRWDTGFWSRYDLFPHRLPNIASSMYHHLHIGQLRAMAKLGAPGPFAETADRWEAYAARRAGSARAFAQKALFRVVTPRNPRLARRLPWVRSA